MIELKDVIAFFAILVTLILGIYNAIQNYRNSRRTTFINTVTSERVKWIEKLRQNIATFCGLVHYWRFSTDPNTEEEREKIEEIDKLRHLIALQLNPRGRIDQEIEALIGQIVTAASKRKGVPKKEFRGLLKDLVVKTKSLLKEEWEKVKEESLLGDISRTEI